MLKKAGTILALMAILVSRTADAANPTIYAAGSLRAAFTALIDRHAANTGVRFTPTFGPSGSLREAIENGQTPDIFASANLEHPQTLHSKGILQEPIVFAANHLCLLAAPGIEINRSDLLGTMLNPSLRLATSIPKADPAGDYTWMLFRKAELLKPGAYNTLDRKAIKLLGTPDANGKPLGVLDLLSGTPKADLVIAYCSYGGLASEKAPGSSWAVFPSDLDVPSRYGIAASVRSDQRAEQFIRFLRSPEGMSILKQYGFAQ